jgi:hypothetical protein
MGSQLLQISVAIEGEVDFLIDRPQKMYLNFVTLLREDEEWRVHDVGPAMIRPQDLGRRPYSW